MGKGLSKIFNGKKKVEPKFGSSCCSTHGEDIVIQPLGRPYVNIGKLKKQHLKEIEDIKTLHQEKRKEILEDSKLAIASVKKHYSEKVLDVGKSPNVKILEMQEKLQGIAKLYVQTVIDIAHIKLEIEKNAKPSITRVGA